MAEHVLTGFGFGPIQAGLFVSEAFCSGNFKRIVVAEIDKALVDAVKSNNGSYFVNVAQADGIEVTRIDNIELLNPHIDNDRKVLLGALARSTEIVTSLPSVSFYTSGGADSVVALIAQGLQSSPGPAAGAPQGTLIYTAENNNRAAEILSQNVGKATVGSLQHPAQYLNTVIGKMSRAVTDAAEIAQLGLTPIAPGIERAILVEEFNRILVTRCGLAAFQPGIKVFVEKDDLLPFEEAKLYGHNAIHALLAYLGAAKGYRRMTTLKDDTGLMRIARQAFLNESGAAMINKYARRAPAAGRAARLGSPGSCKGPGEDLFTKTGFRNYAEDLLGRMTNQYLADTTDRAGRNPMRKLAYTDRIFGTRALALAYGVEPVNMAMGAVAALVRLLSTVESQALPKDLRFGDINKLSKNQIEKLLRWLWRGQMDKYADKLIEHVQGALPKFIAFVEQ